MAGKRRQPARSIKRTSSKKGRGGGGTGLIGTILGVFILAFVAGGISNGTIHIPGTDPDSPFKVPSISWPTLAPPTDTDAPPAPQAPQDPTAGPYTTALTQLGTLEVKGRAAKTGYTRDQFGTAWKDIDGNGCDTRNDILKRDLTNLTFKDTPKDCVVLTGVLEDKYTGKTINFMRGTDTSGAVQIDHVIALSNAWQTGAQQWDAATRERFANDPSNLIAVDGPTNGKKSDGDAATWLPPNKAYRCEYVRSQVAVKASYGLWVTSAEQSAMADVLKGCG